MLLLLALLVLQDPRSPPRSSWAVRASPERHFAFGSLVSALGNADADGIPDFLLGDPGVRPGDELRIWLVSGQSLRSLWGVRMDGRGQGEPILVPVGDADGDGCPDWLLGLRPWSREGATCASLRSGVDGKEIHFFGVDVSGQQLGRCVAGAGDFDRDGRADVLLGAARGSSPSTTRALVHVCSGCDGGILLRLGDQEPSDAAADAVAGVGDIDGDDVLDFAVATSRPGRPTGQRLLFSGRTGSVITREEYESERPLSGITRIDDYDRDGTDDLLVGGPGMAAIRSGRSLRILLDLGSRMSREEFAEAASWGAVVSVLRGPCFEWGPLLAIADPDTWLWGGSVYLHSARDGRMVRSHTDETNDSDFVHHLGYGMTGIGDIDGDGCEDLLCGTDNSGCACDGRAFVFSGRTGNALHELRERDLEIVEIHPLPK